MLLQDIVSTEYFLYMLLQGIAWGICSDGTCKKGPGFALGHARHVVVGGEVARNHHGFWGVGEIGGHVAAGLRPGKRSGFFSYFNGGYFKFFFHH